MSTAQPSSRLTTTEFRKVELQSPADMAYLVAQTQRAARSKIDVAFPPSAAPTNGEDDGMRRRVEELVQQFVERTWDGVRKNASCNGMDMAGNGSSENGEGNGAEAEGELRSIIFLLRFLPFCLCNLWHLSTARKSTAAALVALRMWIGHVVLRPPDQAKQYAFSCYIHEYPCAHSFYDQNSEIAQSQHRKETMRNY